MPRRCVGDEPATETIGVRLQLADFVLLGQHARQRDIPIATLARHIVKAWLAAEPAPAAPARRASATPATARKSRTSGTRT